MDGKGLTCTTRDWQAPNRIDSCRNQAITTHDSGLAGLGSGGVTGHSEVVGTSSDQYRQTRMCLTTQFHLDEKSAIRRSETRTTVPDTVVGTSRLSTPNRRLGFIRRRKPIGTLSLLFRYGENSGDSGHESGRPGQNISPRVSAV